MAELLTSNYVSSVHKSVGRSRIAKHVRILFYFFGLYMVVPLIDVPLLGFSLSAPIFFFIAMEAIFRPQRAWLQRYQRWILLAAAIWIGIFFSGMLNGIFSGGVDFDNEGLASIIRYAYWLLVFVITTYLVSEGGLGPMVARLLAWGVFALALLRWAEVLLYGSLGAWSGTRLMAQNSYGFLFSSFSPLLFSMIILSRGTMRWLAVFANIVLWGAAAINGSRGSWVGISVAVTVQILLLLFLRPRASVLPIFVVLLTVSLGALVLATPNPVAEAVESRFSTFNKLEEDKSFAIRLLMNQKALRLFWENPLIGVGPARFRKESTPLDIPVVLSYAFQSHFDRKSAHNSYMGFLAETGMAGAIPFGLLLLILISKGGISAIVLVKRGQFWAAGVYSGFVGMSVHMWVINSLTNSANWMLYGLVAAMIVIVQRMGTMKNGVYQDSRGRLAKYHADNEFT